MKVQQTLAQTWKRRRDSDHAEAKRLIDAILWSWSIYPFVFFILAKTESRLLGFLAVLGAYGAWGVANAIGCVVAMEAVRSRAWAGVFVWFGAAAAWNACLFRSRPVVRRAKVA